MNTRIAVALALCLALILLLTGCALHFGGGSGESGSAKLYKGELVPEDFSVLELDVNVADITIGPGVSWRVEYGLYEEPEITQEGGAFSLREKEGHWNVVNLHSGTDPYVRVTVPADRLDQVTILLDVGDTKICNLDFGALRIDQDTGDLHLEGMILDSLAVDLDTGDGLLRDVSVLTTAELKSDVGNLRLENVSAVELLSAEIDTGDVRAAHLTAPIVNVSCDTGDIEMEDVNADAITAGSDTGEVELELPGAPEDYAMDLRTNVGEVEVNDADQGDKFTSAGGAKTLTAHSDVGDVEVRFRG